MPRESYCCRSCVYPRTPPIGVALSCETPISNINCCCRGRLAPSSKKNRGMEISLLLSLDAINAPTLSITNMLTFPPSLTLSGLRFLFYTECDILLDFIADNIHPHTKFNTTIEIRFKKRLRSFSSLPVPTMRVVLILEVLVSVVVLANQIPELDIPNLGYTEQWTRNKHRHMLYRSGVHRLSTTRKKPLRGFGTSRVASSAAIKHMEWRCSSGGRIHFFSPLGRKRCTAVSPKTSRGGVLRCHFYLGAGP